MAGTVWGVMVSKNVRMSAELWAEAAEFAAANGETVSVVLRRALVEYVRVNRERDR